MFLDQCADWEMYDGLDCVCANDNSSKCSNDDDGMVCDDKGGLYKSKCDYALQTCQQKISLDRDIRSCGLYIHCIPSIKITCEKKD